MFPLPFTHQINMYKEGRTDASFLPLESVVEGQVCSPGPHLASMNAAVCCRSLQEAQSCIKEAVMCPLPQWLALPLGHLPAGQEPQAGAPCQHCQLQCCCQPPQSEVWRTLEENFFRNTTLIMLMQTSLGF